MSCTLPRPLCDEKYLAFVQLLSLRSGPWASQGMGRQRAQWGRQGVLGSLQQAGQLQAGSGSGPVPVMAERRTGIWGQEEESPSTGEHRGCGWLGGLTVGLVDRSLYLMVGLGAAWGCRASLHKHGPISWAPDLLTVQLKKASAEVWLLDIGGVLGLEMPILGVSLGISACWPCSTLRGRCWIDGGMGGHARWC